MVDRRRPTDLWHPLTYAEGPLPALSPRRGEPRPPALSVSAIAVSVNDTPPYVPVPGITGQWRQETEQVLAGLGMRQRVGGYAVLTEAPPGADVAERALAALGRLDHPEPFYLVRSGPGPDPFVAMLPSLVHQFPWLGDDLGITHLDELGGLALFGLLSWSVPAGGGAIALVVDQPVYVPDDHTPATVSAVALRVHRGAGPVRVTAWAEGPPPVAALASVSAVFSGPGPCDAWLALHEALRSGTVRDGDRVLLRAGRGDAEAWGQLEIIDRGGLRLGTGSCHDDR
ncbi:hypothetical protein [Actinophytocola sediminis]